MPEQIIDAESFTYLADSEHKKQIDIIPQYSEAEMIELISEYEDMMKVGATISALFLLLYIFANQIMSKLNKLMI